MVRELLLIGGILVALAVVTLVASYPPEPVMLLGREVMLVMLAVGVPIEIVYFASLGWMARDRLPSGWYWRSFDHHHLLRARERWWIMPWFYVGALAMLIGTVGIGVTLLGLVALVFRG